MKSSYRTLLTRFILFIILWWLLTDGDVSSWPVGLPVVLLATYVSMQMLPDVSWSLSGIVHFMLFFLWYSLRGGIDVAWRALHPDMPISPALHNHRCRLPAGPPRILMANVLNLLPGSLSIELDEEYLKVHVIDDNGAFAKELKMLEEQLAGALNVDLIEDSDR